MDINQFSIYSVISSSGEKDAKSIQKILELTDKLDSTSTAYEAKQCLEKNLNLTTCVKNYYINEACILNTKETNNTFSINLVYKNENITFCYNK